MSDYKSTRKNPVHLTGASSTTTMIGDELMRYFKPGDTVRMDVEVSVVRGWLEDDGQTGSEIKYRIKRIAQIDEEASDV